MHCFFSLVFVGGFFLTSIYVAAFFLVLLHELGHCYAARKLGSEPSKIVLYPFGGAAMIDISTNPKNELIVAIAGPLVNLVLLAPTWLLAISTQNFESPMINQFFVQVAFINLLLMVFNLVPAFPMDGGRVLRATLSKIWRNHYKATRVSVRISQIFCLLFVIYGLLKVSLMLVAIGVFIALAAQDELQRINRENFPKFSFWENNKDRLPHDKQSDIQTSATMLKKVSKRISNSEIRAFASEND